MSAAIFETLLAVIVVVVGFLCGCADRLIGKFDGSRSKAERDAQWAVWTATSRSGESRGKE